MAAAGGGQLTKVVEEGRQLREAELDGLCEVSLLPVVLHRLRGGRGHAQCARGARGGERAAHRRVGDSHALLTRCFLGEGRHRCGSYHSFTVKENLDLVLLLRLGVLRVRC